MQHTHHDTNLGVNARTQQQLMQESFECNQATSTSDKLPWTLASRLGRPMMAGLQCVFLW